MGLVGNESKNTQLVCVVGLLYNIPSIIQSMGRIRMNRRKSYSEFAILIPKENKSKLHLDRIDSRQNYIGLLAHRVVGKGRQKMYMSCMTVSSVYDWINTDIGCRVVSLGVRMGYKQNKCNKCDMCLGTSVNLSSIGKKKAIDMNNIMKQTGIEILRKLKNHCLVCMETSCYGTCVAKQRNGIICYHCLGKHRAKECKKEYRTILEGKACYSCYQYNYNAEAIHDYSTCTKPGQIQEKLRCLIHSTYLECKKNGSRSTILEYLAGIYSSEETFFRYLYKFKDMK